MRFEVIKNQVVAFSSDNFEIGALTVASEGFGAYRIEMIQINERFKGKGYYRQILSAAFDLLKIDTLYSFNRNELSNPIYKAWTGDDTLSGQKRVWIEKLNDVLCFTID